MLRAVLLCVFLLAGCHQGTPKVSDEVMQKIRADMPGMTAACLDKWQWGGSEALPKDNDECFQFTVPMRMHGLWRNDFEGSEYCDGPASRCPDAKVDADSGIWLEMRFPLGGWQETRPGGVYAIDFIGRRSLGEGGFGGYGLAKHEVIVDRLFSIKEVQPPPRQPTRAETVKFYTECEKQGTCVPNWGYINALSEAQEKKAYIDAYLKDCASKPICIPNSEMPKAK